MRTGVCALTIDKDFEADGKIPLFPESSFSVPFRYGMRLRDDFEASVAVKVPHSQHLPPIMLAVPPVLLVDGHRQELLNRSSLELHAAPPAATAYQAYCVMEIPVEDWHSREVQFLRFYYRHIEPTRLGINTGGDEPAWKLALKEIFQSPWLYRYLCRHVAGDRELSNQQLARLLWYQASPKTIANYKSELRKSGPIQGKLLKKAASIVRLDDYR